MRPDIKPTVDCVFRAILGSRDYLLMHFLNAMLSETFTDIEITRPFDLKDLGEYPGIIDLRACDSSGTECEIEVRMTRPQGLPQRMMYAWAEKYCVQPEYDLKPVHIVWVLDGAFYDDYLKLNFLAGCREYDYVLSPHLNMHVLQTANLDRDAAITDDVERWAWLFKEGRHLDTENLPEWMDTPEMKEVISILRVFAEDDDYHALYLDRRERQYAEELGFF